jgi:PPP family 3-phenylpropionic acid transporter
MAPQMAEPALSPDFFVKPPRFELRMSLLYAALFVPVGVHLPYFPLWLEESGLDATQIALVLSAPMFLRVVTTPFITAFADRVEDRAHVLIGVVAVSFVLSLGYLLQPGYAAVLAISLALQIFWTPHSPLADSLALSGVRRFGVDYPSLRKWGSAAFLAANLAGGAILAVAGSRAVPAIISTGLALTLLASIAAPRLGRPRQPSPLSAERLGVGSASLLNRRFVLLAAGAGVINASHGLLYGFATIYWKTAGIGEGVIGLLWAIAVVMEVVVMLAFRRVFGRLSAPGVLIVAGCAAALRWTLFPLVVPSGAGAAGFFAIQTLHALSTGLILIGVPKMIGEMVGEERLGAAQGLVFFGNGLAMAMVTLTSGPLYAALGVTGFHAMTAVALAGVLLIVLARLSPTAPAPTG